MDEVTIRRAEAAIDLGAAAVLGAAVAWVAAQFAFEPSASAACGVLGLAAASAGLRRVRPAAAGFRLAFDAREIDPAELILTEAERHADADELVLDDALSPPAPDARVVRLFDVSAMPADRNSALPHPAPPDASQALFTALADLRRSLH